MLRPGGRCHAIRNVDATHMKAGVVDWIRSGCVQHAHRPLLQLEHVATLEAPSNVSMDLARVLFAWNDADDDISVKPEEREHLIQRFTEGNTGYHEVVHYLETPCARPYLETHPKAYLVFLEAYKDFPDEAVDMLGTRTHLLEADLARLREASR